MQQAVLWCRHGIVRRRDELDEPVVKRADGGVKRLEPVDADGLQVMPEHRFERATPVGIDVDLLGQALRILQPLAVEPALALLVLGHGRLLQRFE